MAYAKNISSRRGVSKIPQTQPLPGKEQIQNKAGGFVYKADQFDVLDRFLILGCEGGTYYAEEKEITLESKKVIEDCMNADPFKTVGMIVSASTGRAPKNKAAVFALAVAAAHPTDSKIALDQLETVCRIPTHLFQFIETARKLRGDGSGFRNAIKRWYAGRSIDQLVYQGTKYQNREGWTHRDVFRVAHPNPGQDAKRQQAYRWLAGHDVEPLNEYHAAVLALNQIIAPQENGVVNSHQFNLANKLIRDHRLPWEVIPTHLLKDARIWQSLIAAEIPDQALIRNLGRMSACGVFTNNPELESLVCARIALATLHPMDFLIAQRVYGSGHGVRGSLSWNVSSNIAKALETAFYTGFDRVKPTGKNLMVSMDISGSMGSPCAGTPAVTCMDATAAMALMFVRTEKNVETNAFSDHYISAPFNKRTTISNAIEWARRVGFGGTDCSLPVINALKTNKHVDAFITMTDSETWAGSTHLSEVLREYRRRVNPNARYVLAAFATNNNQLFEPGDRLSMNCVGLDSSLPVLVNRFIAEEF